jgi:hypothetical protein
MLNRYFIAGALAAGLAGVASAQQPPSPTSPAPQAPAATRAAQKPATTIVGCVYHEKDVPGRAPNLAEKVGVLEDYILAEVPSTPAAGKPGATDTKGTQTPGVAGTSGSSGAMYKLELVDDDKLKALVGKRVEVVGRIDAEAGDARAPAPATPTSPTDKALGRDRVDLAEFEVASIKEVPGTCPATPTGR